MRSYRSIGALTLIAIAMSVAPISGASAVPCSLSGSGVSGDPYLITNDNDLECLLNTASYWTSTTYLRQTTNVDMTGQVWSSGIAAGASFDGKYDGDGHVISGLTLSRSSNTADSYLGLFENLGSSADIRNLGLTDISVSLRNTKTDAGVTTQTIAGAFAGSIEVGTVLSGIFSTGSISATGDSEVAVVKAGGLVGYSSGGCISNSYSLASVSATSAATSPGAAESAWAGGLAGHQLTWSCTPFQHSFSAGNVSAQTAGADRWQGGVAGLVAPIGGNFVAVDGIAWDVNTSGQSSCSLYSGINGECAGLSTGQMKNLSSYVSLGWSVSYGLSGPTTWGLCPAINSGYPFLRAFAQAGACEISGEFPPPWYQSYARADASQTCEAGWYPGWDTWPWGRTGGWVCNRKLSYNGSMWISGPST